MSLARVGPPPGPGDPWRNQLIHGDNADAMAALERSFSGSIDLIYADPPFATGGDFRYSRRNGEKAGALAYEDSWPGGIDSYLQMLYERLLPMHRLLSDRGSLYLHIDWRAGHYAHLLLDEIFGNGAFRNMIAWHYGGRGAKAVAGQFPRNYDLILYYSKTSAAPFFRPYSVERLPVGQASRRGFRRDEEGRWFKTAPRGDYTDESVARLAAEGRIHHTRTGKVRVKYFLDEEDGHVVERQPMGDVWNDIPDMMHAPAAERTGFPTQKPKALLSRIIEASTSEGGLVADFFCGSGTALVAAETLGRRWIGCDSGEAAIEVTRERLGAIRGHRPFYELRSAHGPD
jgi:DNA modification methylase